MTLSVLMSVYYKEKPEYLQQALKSIWDDQTVKPDEIILVEDGKLTVELYEIIEQWGEKLNGRLKRIPLPENQGLAKALNTGIKYCSGEYIARMDSDDISASERFEKQTRFLKNNPDIDILGSFSYDIDNNNKIIKERKVPQEHNQIEKLLPKLNPMTHPSVMFKKNSIIKIGCYDEKYKTSQDYHLWFKAIANGLKLKNLSDFLLYYRMDSEYPKKKSFIYRFNEFKIKVNGYRLINYPWFRYYNALISLFLAFAPSFLFKYLKKLDPR